VVFQEDAMFGRSSGKIDLPSVPTTLARVIQITSRLDTTAEQVAKVVMLDQSLATKVLRLANSAFYGRRMKAQTVTEAVVTLGFTAIRNLAASASIVDALFPKRLFPGFSWQDMWIHSVTCGLGTEALLARMIGRSHGANESAFVAGLLHDVGKLILARALPQRFVQIVEICREYGYQMVRAESNELSTNHARIGGELAAEWQFPNILQAGIAYHHSPEEAVEYEEFARSVYAANLLSKRLGRSYLEGVSVDVSLAEVAEAAKLTVAEVETAVDQVREGLRQCSEILSWGDKMPGAERSRRAA
jgi:HD-like signal output (HDOD) protein